ncbi:MAG: hypothetical protein IJF60_07125 [Agathobacter sp.]|nr:hypothetical protein [Agathobacter sp.]
MELHKYISRAPAITSLVTHKYDKKNGAPDGAPFFEEFSYENVYNKKGML